MDIPSLATWLLSLIDAETAGYDRLDAPAIETAQTQFDVGMQSLRSQLEARTELTSAERTSLVALQEAIDLHTDYITSMHRSYGRELHGLRAHAQIASYAPVKLDAVPTPRYFDKAG
jgi:hypothetical protein